jgi:hypothetical protein
MAVDVEVESAVVMYRPAAGAKRSVPARVVSPAALFGAYPWRTFRWYLGQRHYSGTYWSATDRDHVIYESRLELANLLLADFDPSVRHIVAQPFMLVARVDGEPSRHILDYLWDSDYGPVVVDVVRTERLGTPKVAKLCEWTRAVVESRGWTYSVVSEPDRVRLANIRFLAGYRRDWLFRQDILNEVRARREELAGLSIRDAEAAMTKFPKPLVRAAFMHLLWIHEYSVDLNQSLSPSMVLEVSP